MKLSTLKRLIKEEILREIKVERKGLNINPELKAKWESNPDRGLQYSFEAAMETFKELEENGLNVYVAEIVPAESIDWLWNKYTNIGMMVNPEEATLLFKKGDEQIVLVKDYGSYVLETNVPEIAELPEVEDHVFADDAARIINDWYDGMIG
jgi:hypothetical protein